MSAHPYSCDEGERRPRFDLLGELPDGRAIEIFGDGDGETFSIRVYGLPPVGRVALGVAGRRVPLVGPLDAYGYGRIRRADLPGHSVKSLSSGELSLILGEAGAE
jgi:hypothetical protein